MLSKRIIACTIFIVSLIVGYGLFSDSSKFSGYTLGLDLSGGTRLVYDINTKGSQGSDLQVALASLRDTVERRVNTFGVSEPVVYTQGYSSPDGSGSRLLVEIPNVSDLETAKGIIGDTPVLEFKTLKPGIKDPGSKTPDEIFVSTKLTGEFLQRAQVQFSNQGGVGAGLQGAMIAITFNSEGTKLFADITKKHLGEPVAIYLDGELLSAPVVQAEIVTGQAVITGNFTVDEAEALAKRLNAGALPLEITMVSSDVVQPLLGSSALSASMLAGLVALAVIALFMTLWYRLPGFLSSVALITYAVVVLLLFKYIPVTLSTAGIAGFIISMGIAVDANILIFERAKEELKKDKEIKAAFLEGFARAWPSIRDSNISSLISAVILFSFGSSLVKGFALTFGIGVLVSLVTAVAVTRLYVNVFATSGSRWWVLSGFSK